MRTNTLSYAKGTKKYCRLCGLNYHDTNKCEELLPIISLEKKRRAEASQKNYYNRFRDKDYVHKHEIDAMVKEK